MRGVIGLGLLSFWTKMILNEILGVENFPCKVRIKQY